MSDQSFRVAASRAEEREKDIFTKSEKWLPAMPLPDFSKWSKSRQEEILCFSEYMSQFRSWIALASDTFAFEIESAIRHPEELHMGGLKPAQQLRSSRLLAMLQQIFTPYPRASMLIQAYVEGIGLMGFLLLIEAQVDLKPSDFLERSFLSGHELKHRSFLPKC